MICFAFIHCLIVHQPEDEDEVEFQTEIRTAVLEAYTGIAQGYAAGNKDISRELVPHLPAIVGFCQRISDGIFAAGEDAYSEDRNPDLIEKAVGLLGYVDIVWPPCLSCALIMLAATGPTCFYG